MEVSLKELSISFHLSLFSSPRETDTREEGREREAKVK